NQVLKLRDQRAVGLPAEGPRLTDRADHLGSGDSSGSLHQDLELTKHPGELVFEGLSIAAVPPFLLGPQESRLQPAEDSWCRGAGEVLLAFLLPPGLAYLPPFAQPFRIIRWQRLRGRCRFFRCGPGGLLRGGLVG